MSLARLSHMRHQQCRAEGALETSWFHHSVTEKQTEAQKGEGSGWPDLGLKPRALTPPISSPPPHPNWILFDQAPNGLSDSQLRAGVVNRALDSEPEGLASFLHLHIKQPCKYPAVQGGPPPFSKLQSPRRESGSHSAVSHGN